MLRNYEIRERHPARPANSHTLLTTPHQSNSGKVSHRRRFRIQSDRLFGVAIPAEFYLALGLQR